MRHHPRSSPRSITVGRRIAAAPEEVWSVISAPGYLEECHPFCAANPVDVWPGADSHDAIEYHNGRVVERRFTAWREGGGYDLEVSDAGGSLASVSWRISPAGSETSLAISLVPRMLGGAPAAARWVTTRHSTPRRTARK